MMKKKLFEKNLKILKHSYFASCFKKNLNFHNASPPDSQDQTTIEEAKQLFSCLPKIEHNCALFIYGIGNGNYYLAAKQWLKNTPDSHLIFLENNLYIIQKFLEMDLATDCLSSPQIHICHWKHTNNLDLFYNLAWFFGKLDYFIYPSKHYEITQKKLFQELKIKIMGSFAEVHNAHYTTLRFGEEFYLNYYLNLTTLDKSFQASCLFKKFKNVPAIICGAGPSLNKSLKLLKKQQKKALIFSAGSSLTPLSKSGINPHLSVILDPTPLLYTHLEENLSFETPLLYSSRAFWESVNAHHGPKLHIAGSGRYFISQWFEKQLGIKKKENLSMGPSVSTFSLSISHALGCNPIIFIGMDLAYTKQRHYASDIEEKALQENDLITYRDIYQVPSNTNIDWIMESHWVTEFAKNHPECTFINATEGGIGFEHISNLSLQAVFEKYLLNEYDLSNHVHSEIHNRSLPILKKKHIYTSMNIMKKSLENCLILCEKLIKKTLYAIDNAETLTSSQKMICQISQDLKDEIAYNYILSPLLDYYDRMLALEQYLLKRKRFSNESAHLTIQVKKITYLRQAIESNLDYLDNSLYYSPSE